MRLSALFLVGTVLAGAAHAQDPAAILTANKVAAGGAAWDGKAAVDVTHAYSGQGLTGVTGSIYDAATGFFIDSQQLGPVTGLNGFDGQQAWMKDMSGAVTPEAGGDARQLAVNEAYRDANLWWRPDFGGAKVAMLGAKTEGGKTFDVVSITPVGGKAFEAWFDAQTHLLARTIEPQGSRTLTIFYSDYRPTEGALFAGKQVIDDGSGEQYRQTQTLTDAKFVPARPATAYSAPGWTNTDLTSPIRDWPHHRAVSVDQQSHLRAGEGQRQRPLPVHLRHRRSGYPHAGHGQGSGRGIPGRRRRRRRRRRGRRCRLLQGRDLPDRRSVDQGPDDRGGAV